MSRRVPVTEQVARGLGWFSIGLGLIELLRPEPTARTVGARGGPRLVQAYGLREIATGVGLLTFKDPAPWLWARVVGDVVDAVTVGANIKTGNPGARNARFSLVAVMGVLALDAAVAFAASQRAARLNQPVHDYSDRSGWPSSSPEEMRGLAAGDLEGAEDLRIPSALRSYKLH
ncbi:MAG: hypothetical protein EOP38_04780 [Rubrivivax sp.]|nr:MAG: hypothetical protein EOP38_04780 [Rubrivivax sp.]